MLNMKLSNAYIGPATGAVMPGETQIIRKSANGDSMLPNAPISLSCANFPREQGTRTANGPLAL